MKKRRQKNKRKKNNQNDKSTRRRDIFANITTVALEVNLREKHIISYKENEKKPKERQGVIKMWWSSILSLCIASSCPEAFFKDLNWSFVWNFAGDGHRHKSQDRRKNSTISHLRCCPNSGSGHHKRHFPNEIWTDYGEDFFLLLYVPENKYAGIAIVWGNCRVFSCMSEFPCEPD